MLQRRLNCGVGASVEEGVSGEGQHCLGGYLPQSGGNPTRCDLALARQGGADTHIHTNKTHTKNKHGKRTARLANICIAIAAYRMHAIITASLLATWLNNVALRLDLAQVRHGCMQRDMIHDCFA